jgi:hypothetical protein
MLARECIASHSIQNDHSSMVFLQTNPSTFVTERSLIALKICVSVQEPLCSEEHQIASFQFVYNKHFALRTCRLQTSDFEVKHCQIRIDG